MLNHNLQEYATKFTELKERLRDCKLSDHDAALLASRLLELPAGTPSSLYFEVKQQDRFKPYRFLASGLVVKKIESTSSYMKLSISLKRGIHQVSFPLTKTRALLFFTLLALKFKNFEQDAIGGFGDEIDTFSFDIGKKLGIESDAFSNTNFDGLKRTLNEHDYGDLIERNESLSRLSVPPHHISFEESARKVFEELTGNKLEQFESRFGTKVFSVL